MERWIEFIGHFHPVFVHLPIGILLITALLMSLLAYQKIQLGPDLLKILLIAGVVSAVVSCITGFLLSQSGEYDAATLNLHQWMGISVAVISVASYFIMQKINTDKVILFSISIVFVVFVSITGHLGGSLTHGSDYLTSPLQSAPLDGNLLSINLDSAEFYNDLVRPILKAKCYSCHGSGKQKGKLRLDEKEYILKGGKHGEVIAVGKPNDSELIARVELDISNKEHMPPKEKPQLTEQETEVIKLWIESGADFEIQVVKVSNFQKIKDIIHTNTAVKSSDVPEREIAGASDSEINKLTELRITITPVVSESPYLSVSLISIPSQANKTIGSLIAIKDNIVWLKLSGTNADDSGATVLSAFSNLTKLHLDDTKITDDALKSISSLKNLQYLNLKGTAVSLSGLQNLKDLKNLKSLFLYQTKVTEKEEERIRELFPQTEINFGNYSVPTLESDTSIVKVK